ncbi:hypothetical protein D9M68_904430 [compost metagenome]
MPVLPVLAISCQTSTRQARPSTGGNTAIQKPRKSRLAADGRALTVAGAAGASVLGGLMAFPMGLAWDVAGGAMASSGE